MDRALRVAVNLHWRQRLVHFYRWIGGWIAMDRDGSRVQDHTLKAKMGFEICFKPRTRLPRALYSARGKSGTPPAQIAMAALALVAKG